MRASFPTVMLVVVASCGSKDTVPEPSKEPSKASSKEPDKEPSPDPSKGPRNAKGPSDPQQPGEVRGPVAFGDCARQTVAWVSGPRPLPFTLEQADGVWAAAAPLGEEWNGRGPRKVFGEGKPGKPVLPEGIQPWATIAAARYGGTSPPPHPQEGYATRGQPGPRPKIFVGVPTVQGDLDKVVLRRYLQRSVGKILRTCYGKELLVRPDLEGTVETQFFIEPNGSVADVTASGVDRTVASCIVEVIQLIQFPQPKGRVQVNYPFVFRAEGDEAPTIRPNEIGGIVGNHKLFRDGVVDTSRYVPGATNPLRGEEPALTECFRTNPKHHGAVVVTLTYGAGGGVATATTHGLDDARTSACVIAAAKRIKRADPGPAAQRCSLAFGEMEVAGLATIDITDSISLDGKKLTTTAAVKKSYDSTISELASAVATRRMPILDRDGPVVAIHGPNVIRPLDATPMKVVLRVVASVLGERDDLVLAARRGASWKLLRPMTFPVIPVPYGTGGRWNPIKGEGYGSAGAKARVTLSLLITADEHVLIGRENEFEDLRPDATQSDRLAAALKKHKVSAAFADRVDVEIAGDDWATYGGVVRLIDAAEAAGFVDWRVANASSLVANPNKTSRF